MANEKLVTLLAKYEQVKKDASIDLAGWDPRTRMGVETRKRMADAELPSVADEYKRAAREVVVKVFLLGDTDKVEKVVSAIKDEVMVLRADELYRRLATPIERTLDAKRIFGTSQAVRLIEEMAEFARGNRIKELPMPKLDANHYHAGTSNIEDTIAIVRKAVRSTSEDDLNAYFLSKEALNLALERRISGSVLPVIIVAATPEELEKLPTALFAGRPNIVVSVNDHEDGEDFVSDVMNHIASKFVAKQP